VLDFLLRPAPCGRARNEREIDLFVEFDQSCLFDFFAKYGSEPAGDVGGFGEIVIGLEPAELEIEAAESDVRQAVRGVSGVEQIGIQHGIVLDTLQVDAECVE